MGQGDLTVPRLFSPIPGPKVFNESQWGNAMQNPKILVNKRLYKRAHQFLAHSVEWNALRLAMCGRLMGLHWWMLRIVMVLEEYRPLWHSCGGRNRAVYLCRRHRGMNIKGFHHYVSHPYIHDCRQTKYIIWW